MTREHKLALIVGFSLVLIVGVLISDHFSPARTQDVSAGAMSAGTPVKFGSSPDGLRVPSEPTSATHLPDTLTSNQVANRLPEQPTFQPPPAPAATPAASPTEMVMGAPQQPQQTPAIPDALRGDFEPASGAMGERLAVGNTGVETPDSGAPAPIVPSAVLTRPVDQPTPPVVPGKPYSAGSLKRYTIEEGDSIYRIAVTHYGDGNLWSKLREFNPGKIGSDGEMRGGVVLELPPKDVLLGQAVLPPPGVKPPRSSEPPTKADSPLKRDGAAPGYAVYVVQKGDELGPIAKKTLGSVKRWREIAALNKDVLPDPDVLTEGLKLRIPAR